jgi:hypothetical protein
MSVEDLVDSRFERVFFVVELHTNKYVIGQVFIADTSIDPPYTKPRHRFRLQHPKLEQLDPSFFQL